MKNLGLTGAIVSAIVLGQSSIRPAQATDPATLAIALAPVVIPLIAYAITKDVCVLPIEWGSPKCAAANKGNTDKPKTSALPPSNQFAFGNQSASDNQYAARRDTE